MSAPRLRSRSTEGPKDRRWGYEVNGANDEWGPTIWRATNRMNVATNVGLRRSRGKVTKGPHEVRAPKYNVVATNEGCESHVSSHE